MKIQYPIPVPKETVSALKLLDKQPANPALLFDRFTPDLSQAGDKEKSKWKNEALKVIVSRLADKKTLEHYVARWEKVIEQTNAKVIKLKTDWRMIAGLGRKGALEIGFTFHRYGFAMLPGSSVKGIARAWAFYSIAEQLGLEGEALSKLDILLNLEDEKTQADGLDQFSPKKEASENIKAFREVFGTTAQAGKAIFFDAIPTKPPRLKLDIMNPHYPDYYSDKSNTVYPTNWQSPNPIFFLTVDEEQEFCFAVGWRGVGDSPLRAQAEAWLKEGLLNLGAGAKTSAGYGYFKT